MIDNLLGKYTRCVLRPAYGRIYETKEELLEAWDTEQKDFEMQNGMYCSIRDIKYLQNEFDIIYIYSDYKYSIVIVL